MSELDEVAQGFVPSPDDQPEPSLGEVASVAPTDVETTLFQQLATQRESTASRRETFITIPGYEGSGIELLAQYKLLDGPTLERIGTKNNLGATRKRGLWASNMNAALDVLNTACTGIYFQRETDEKPLPLTVGLQAISGYGDPNLKTALGIDPSIDTARKVIIAVFCDNELAVSNHSIKLQRWFVDANANVDAEFLGE